MTNAQRKHIEAWLDERWEIALMTDEQLGNKDGKEFIPNNCDWVYYKGILAGLEACGYEWQREGKKHYIYKA